ncbi:hypothetical protein [Paenibacillus agilis]|uniref:Uncharacterized protein n=1 Tax=Paenibacillus agilis TaxID=3020863 RepID=A0A559IDA3_9BACL|nr:hypothetical protein [Paenibacillus agilis]TVX85637.1 hypothetical protein FPZ44_25130 [Paenibacillus agilis]
MSDLRYLMHSIFWCSESIYNCEELANFLIRNGVAGQYAEISKIPSTQRYCVGKPMIFTLIYDTWRLLAKHRAVCLELRHNNFYIHPIIYPHLLINFFHSKSILSSSTPTMHAAAVGKQLRFNIWEGNNAPTSMHNWTGTVLSKVKRSNNPIEYIIRREHDDEIIKLTRDYLLPIQKKL